MELDKFTRAYVECAVWASTNGDEPLDRTHAVGDIAPEALAKMAEDCRQFQSANAELLAEAGSLEQNGHDFWLTRNRHGAGFWDRGYPAAIGDKLTTAAHTWGESDLYVGDDGKVYVA